MLAQMRERLTRCDTFEQAIEMLLNDAIALQGAEFGNVQLLVQDELVIAAQRNFAPEFLKAFSRVTTGDGTACGRALRAGRSIVISDVENDDEFAPFRAEAKLAGFRAVQSTPLATGAGTPLGIVSTHFANVHQPTQIEMDTLQAYVRIAAEFLFEQLGDTPLAVMGTRMSEGLEHAHASPRSGEDGRSKP